MPKDTTTLKMSDIEKVSKKLDGFMEKLPDQEKEVLGWILARAQAAGDTEVPLKPVSPTRSRKVLASSVATAAKRPAISQNLAKAAGLGTAGAKASEITVSWKHKFDGKALGGAVKTPQINPVTLRTRKKK